MLVIFSFGKVLVLFIGDLLRKRKQKFEDKKGRSL